MLGLEGIDLVMKKRDSVHLGMLNVKILYLSRIVDGDANGVGLKK